MSGPPTAEQRRIAKGLYELGLVPDPSTITEWTIEPVGPKELIVRARTIKIVRGETLAAVRALLASEPTYVATAEELRL